MLLSALMMRDFRSKYAGSMMGVFWSVVNPLLLLLVFTFVFTVIFQIRLGASPGFAHNALYIFCGVLPWIAFQESVQRSATVLIDQKNMVTRVMFPSEILPASVAASSYMGMIVGMVVLLASVIWVTGRLPATALLLPVLVILQAAFTLGLAWLVSSVNVFFRDLQQLVPVGLLVWMYATPIFYSPEMVPEKIEVGGRQVDNLRLILTLNPMHHMVAAYRATLIDGTLPSAGGVVALALFSVISLSLGWIAFARGRSRFADVL